MQNTILTTKEFELLFRFFCKETSVNAHFTLDDIYEYCNINCERLLGYRYVDDFKINLERFCSNKFKVTYISLKLTDGNITTKKFELM